MKVLITGNRGFIGSHLQKKIDADSVGYDIVDGKDILEMKPKDFAGIDYVFHLAAEVNVQKSVENPIETFRTNVSGTMNVLECAIHSESVKRVIFSSSAAIYGINAKNDRTGKAYEEFDEKKPLSPYGFSKLIGEELCKMYSTTYGLDTVCLRYFNVYGDGMKCDSPYSAAVAIFLDKKKNGMPLPVFGGKQTRDFVSVDDVVNANISAMSYPFPLNGEPINIGSSISTVIDDVARKISDDILYYQQRDNEPMHSRANIKKAHSILKWLPKTDFMKWLESVCAV